MREILFKAKRVDNGKWVKGNLFVENERFEITRGTCNGVGIESVCVDPETISQYTGLCDKNGRKIWENDIVDMNRKGCGFKRIEKVFYEEGAFSPISVHGWECVPDADEIEVIGNIFDNPELLEGN